MKYSLNKKEINLKLKQATISDAEVDFGHVDLMDKKLKWYKRGYTAIEMPSGFLKKIRNRTFEYIEKCVDNSLAVNLNSLPAYHHQVVSDEQHIKVLKKVGKVMKPELLGIDVNLLAAKIKKVCKIDYELSCRDVCDIRIFRPYQGKAMDNNPLHRDTWLPILNKCLNVYIPVAGNNRLSSLSVLPGSHLWNKSEVERTKENAVINEIRYGLPSVTAIKRKFKVVRPLLLENEVLLFSSNMIHGGAVNLNKDITRVSIEIRFWPKSIADKEPVTHPL